MIGSKRSIRLAQIASLGIVFQALASAQFVAAPGSPVTAVPNPSGVAVGDFNEDGTADIAVLGTSSSTLRILVGIGNGSFSLGPSTTLGNAPRAIAAADFNGDGHVDFVIASASATNGNNIVLLTGLGDDNFSQGPTYLAGQSPSAVDAADFNGDGRPDFAVTDQLGDSVLMFLNDSTRPGSFLAPATVNVGKGPFSIVHARFNGTIYLAVANRGGDTVTLLTYTSNAFRQVPGSPFSVIVPNPNSLKPAPASVVLADFNGDAVPDIATANQGTNNVSVLLSNPQGGYTPAANSPFSAGGRTIWLVSSDFNNDGFLDLAAVNGTDSTLTLLLGNAQGGFAAAAGTQPSPGAAPFGTAIGDFNRDGKLDLAIADTGSSTVTVLLNNFPAILTMVSAASYTQPVAPGSIVSIYGTGLAASTASATASNVGLPTTLAGASVILTDSSGLPNPLSLFYVSPTQINALVPTTASPGRARLAVFTGSTTLTGAVPVAQVAPAIFTANQNGQGVAWAQFVNNIFQITNVFQCPGGSATAGPCIATPLNVSPSNCPVGGCHLILYGTGLRNAASGTVSVMIGGQQVPASFAGPSQYAGEDQVNVAIPASLAGSGPASVRLLVAGQAGGTLASNVVSVYIQ